MKPAEALAKRVIEAVEPGARMVFREDQSSRTRDFDLYRPQSAVAAIEVTSITDAAGRAIDAAIARRRRIPRRLCTKDWRIHPAASPSYAADLLGGCAGLSPGSLVLIPTAGLALSARWMAVLALLSHALLQPGRGNRPAGCCR